MRLKFHTLDVFTEKRFGGNPLAVVLAADSRDSPRMQAIAREFNLSETVFVLKPANPTHTARIRIFTPVSEIPFAGHPTVGTATLLGAERVGSLGGTHSALVLLEEVIGTVRVGVRLRTGEAAFAEFDAPKLPEDLGGVPAVDDIAGAVGLIPTEIGFENHRASRFSAGLPYTMIPVRSLEAIGRARAVVGRWERAFGRDGAAYLYCRETVLKTANFHARMFAPAQGVMEDPATGSAAVALAAVVQRFDSPPSAEHRYVIEQGVEMGRPSLIRVAVTMRGGRRSVIVSGTCVPVMRGTLTLGERS